jgi:serine/threonine protein kinase/Tol biopolymer transport system component
MESIQPARFLRFGTFQLDLRAEELRRNGAKIKVPDQSIKVLTMLLHSSGEIVTRQELHQKLWPNGTIVEFDNGINAVIKRLREALEDSAEAPLFIETVPRRGYRFLVPVVPMDVAENVITPPGAPERSPDDLVGQTISHYRIVRKLGQGAMGVVYQADDIKLGRSVAIKFLPEELSDSPRALERFEREARAASALNHPNICAVYELDEHKGQRFIAMEFVGGKSLDQLIKPGGLPALEVLTYAVEMANALATAHSVGIVHRDLKPSNVMIHRDGVVKVLDFGLAKVCQPSGVDLSALPSETPLTVEGTILGTLQYMAPEQLEGREADLRTDIFALGTVIYEMATGRKAFEGKSQASLIAAILERDPLPISSVGPPNSTGLNRIVATCLAKKPENRWQSARDLLRELEWVKEGREPLRKATVSGLTRPALPWILFAAASAALLALAAVHFRQLPSEATVVRFQVPLPSTGRAWEDFPAVSPDGRLVAFSRFTPDDRLGIWIHSLDSLTTRFIPGTAESAFALFRPFWSPDGRFVAFFEGRNSKVDDHPHFYLKKVDLTSGTTQTICETQDSLGGGTWSQDGVILFSQAKFLPTRDVQTHSLYRVSAEGGQASPVLRLDEARQERSQIDPQFLPDGRHFLYRSVDGTGKDAVYVGSLSSNETQLITTVESNVIFIPPRFLLLSRQGTLLAQLFDLQKLRLIGEPVALRAQHVAQLSSHPVVSFFSASQNGVLVYRDAVSRNVQLAWYKRDGARLGAVGEPGPNEGMRISPDERQLVLDRGDPQTELNDVWTVQLSSGIFTRVTFGPSNNIGAEWSPDGRELAFSSDRRLRGLYDVYRKPVAGGNDELLSVSQDQSRFPQQWLRDGSILLNSWPRAAGGRNLFYLLPLSGSREPLLLRKGNKESFTDDAPIVSSDGRCAAYYSDQSGQLEVYVASFPGFREERRVSANGAGAPLWRKDGKELFYITLEGKFMSVDVKCGTRLVTGVPKFLFQVPFPVDVRTIVFCVADNGNKFIFAEPVDSSESLTVVLNWTALLKR